MFLMSNLLLKVFFGLLQMTKEKGVYMREQQNLQENLLPVTDMK
jgi:hypothetical protein